MLPLLYGLIVSATHFWNEKIQIRQEHVRIRLVSFVAGIAVTYVFLVLLPEIYTGFQIFSRAIFIFLLLGFTFTHLVEKYIYQHTTPETLKENLSGVHSVAFFLYYFLIGIILVELNNKFSPLDATLFFLPVLFYSAVGLISLEKIHPKVWERPWIKFILSMSTIAGVLLADLLISFQPFFKLLFGFMVGVFLYVALIDFVPKEARGRPEYFALGVLVYTLVIVSTFV